jgi:hypothetical protein
LEIRSRMGEAESALFPNKVREIAHGGVHLGSRIYATVDNVLITFCNFWDPYRAELDWQSIQIEHVVPV